MSGTPSPRPMTGAATLLGRQLKEIQQGAVPGVSAGTRKADNIFEWEVTLMIDDDTKYYGGGCFRAFMKFPPTYPHAPPKLSFQSPVPYHPNIYENGDVCISILHAGEDETGYEHASERWSPVQTAGTVLLSVLSLFSDPNDESPANPQAAVDWREMRAGTSKKFRDEVRKCVKASVGED